MSDSLQLKRALMRHPGLARIAVVEPTDTSVIAPTSDATLTLVTCYPFYFIGPAPRRFVVHALPVR